MKSNTKLIIGIIIGVIISSSIGVAAYALLSSDIQFTPDNNNWQVGNVEDALNSLYISRANNDYSTDEKVVGTWIDGKPIYQKSIIQTSNFSTIFDIANNIDNVVGWKAIYINSSGISSVTPYVPFTNNITTYYQYAMSGYLNSERKWYPQIGSTTLSTLAKIIYTFEYTKTTD